MLTPLMQSILDERTKNDPTLDRTQEEKFAELGQGLLEKLWVQEEKPTTFWGKVKSVLSDGINLPQILFDRMIDFRVRHGLINKKEDMQHIMLYTTKAFNKGTDILAAGCYLFHHNPRAFQKYATSSTDFNEDIEQSSFDENNVNAGALGIPTIGIPIVANQTEEELYRSDLRRLPLSSFAPIKYGFHPSQKEYQGVFKHYEAIFSERVLYGFKTNPYKYEPLKKLLHFEHPESCYPATHHNAMVIAMNEFNKQLQQEPVKVCSHKGCSVSSDKQKTI